MATAFDANAKVEFGKWDCEAMYPMPVQHKVGLISTITAAGKEAFNIFNQVKGLIPGGSFANLKIPGLPEGVAANIDKGFKTFESFEGKFNEMAGKPSKFQIALKVQELNSRTSKRT